jgi:hypothetical protein
MSADESIGRWRAALVTAAPVNLVVGIALASRGGATDLFRV